MDNNPHDFLLKENSMQNYQNSLRSIKTLVREFVEFYDCSVSEYSEEIEECREELEKLLDDNFYNVIVIGTFSRGKSTFINALIGQRLLYTGDIESTGAITVVQNSSEKTVSVQTAHEKFFFQISDDSYDIIKKFVDKNNRNAKDTEIIIDYPMHGFDNDIRFIDTPGLSGLGKEQKDVTKKALQKANAVILVVDPKGLNLEELNLLKGEYEQFGEIRSDNLIILINKIGMEFSENMTKEQEDKQIEKARTEIVRIIEREGLGEKYRNLKLFAVDSLDYLKAVDDNVYNEYNALKKNTPKTELIRRSRFEEFKFILMDYLESSNRAKNTRRSAADNIVQICDMLSEYYMNVSEEKRLSEENYKKQLNDKIQKITQLKSEAIRQTGGYIRSQINCLNENIQIEMNKNRDLIKKHAADNIDAYFNKNEDFNKNHYDSLYKSTKKEIDDTVIDINHQLSDFYKSFVRQLSQYTDLNFNKVFGQKSGHKYNFEMIKIVSKDIGNIEISDDIENQLKNNIKEIKKKIETEKSSLAKLHKKQVDLTLLYRKKKQIVEEEHQANIRNLGKKPEPRVVTKTKYRKERVFLFFKKDVPYEEKSLDYAPVDEYERKLKTINKDYESKMKTFRDAERHEISALSREIITKENNLKYDGSQLDALLKNLENRQKLNKKRLERYVKYAVDRKKEELTELYNSAVDKAFGEIELQLLNENETVRELLVIQTQDAADDAVMKFREKLEQELSTMNSISNESYESIITRIAEFRKRAQDISI